jgi:Tol biopolymer transport system component
MSQEGQSGPRFSPDGQAVAYGGVVGGHQQVFVRYLGSPVSSQLTSNPEYTYIKRWSPDSKRVLFTAPDPHPPEGGPVRALYSISVVGGEPERLAPVPDYSFYEEVSPDNQTMAISGRLGPAKITVFIASPLGSPFRQYKPDPFATETLYNKDLRMRFSPNGKKLLLVRSGLANREETWILPYPPGTGVPYRVLKNLPAEDQTSDVTWLSDNRHLALALSAAQGNHLWIADTESDDFHQITEGTGSQASLAVSPDEKQIVYQEIKADFDIVAVSLADGRPRKLIATEVTEDMPYWSAGTDKLVYVTSRNGTLEIWMRSADGSDRPLVTRSSFSDGPVRFFMNPAISPDGNQLVFTRVMANGEIRTWILALSAGSLLRLNESATDSEVSGVCRPTAGVSPRSCWLARTRPLSPLRWEPAKSPSSFGTTRSTTSRTGPGTASGSPTSTETDGVWCRRTGRR